MTEKQEEKKPGKGSNGCDPLNLGKAFIAAGISRQLMSRACFSGVCYWW